MTDVAFVVNGGPDSAMAIRARAFAAGLPELRTSLHYRDGSRRAAFASYLSSLEAAHPAVIYVLDLTLPAILAALTSRRRLNSRVIVDTGDATAALLARRHRFGRLGAPLLSRYERAALGSADAIVVRGSGHAAHLALSGLRPSAIIPDGVDLEIFRPADASSLREQLGRGTRLVAGVVGSLHWNARLQWTPGLELVEALAATRSDAIVGLIVGNGSGLQRLRMRAAELGVVDRIHFVDRWQDERRLSAWINAMDVCLSTQTNNVVGAVRTSGKLPLFLACGRFVLATRVGEAARVLPDAMLLDYEGEFDRGYPRRLAARLDAIADDPAIMAAGAAGRDIASAEFDYRVLTRRLSDVLRLVGSRQRAA